MTVESASPNVGIFGYHYWRLRRRPSFGNLGTEGGWLTQSVFCLCGADDRFWEIENPALSLQRTQGQGRGTLLGPASVLRQPHLTERHPSCARVSNRSQFGD